jgi:Metal-dependent hydrolase
MRPRSLLIFVILASSAVSWTEPGAARQVAIKVASYNMASFGRTKLERAATAAVMAEIAARFDLLAMEEVGSNGSTASEETCVEVMDGFLAKVDAAAGGALYAYVRGNQFAFLYRADKLEVLSHGLYDGTRTFSYRPLVARFRVKGTALDFTAMAAHARPSLARAEVPELAAAMDEVAAEFGDPDVLCAGDFNADGSYYDEGTGDSLAGFPDRRFVSAIPNGADTTVATASLTYDRIELSTSMARAWDGSWGVLRPSDYYDLSRCEGSSTTTGTERALSDHYPVWVELRTEFDGN